MAHVVLDGYSQILRLSGIEEAQREVDQAIERALADDPQALLCSSEIAYREFLRHLIVPFIQVRDVLAERLREDVEHEVYWSTIEKSVEKLMTRSRAGGPKNLQLVLRSLRTHFPRDPIRLRRAIIFLDSSARDLAERDFFRFRVCGEEVKLSRQGERSLNAAECLSGSFLRSREAKESRCLCQLTGDITFCPRSRPAESRTDRCLDASELPMRCCSHDLSEVCRLEALLDQQAEVVRRLLEYARSSGFSRRFQERNSGLLVKLESLRGRVRGTELGSFKNESCAEHLSEFLMLLECGEQARLVSYDQRYDELAEAVGWKGFRIDPKAAVTAPPPVTVL